MEYEFSVDGLTRNSSETLINLYRKRKEMIGLLTNSTNEKGKKNSGMVIQTCVSLEFISKLFLSVFSKEVSREEIDTPTSVIRREIDFVQFIVASTCEGIRFVSILE